ncbi:hypothetical protein XENOCAPTIV_030884 [Xenoophorus captivus]|uniref:Uncharacterized protein n=1 Tax=Xenoophorus captivus TaxID=1517983 RepID=A0ABV0RVZ7_9TELE
MILLPFRESCANLLDEGLFALPFSPFSSSLPRVPLRCGILVRMQWFAKVFIPFKLVGTLKPQTSVHFVRILFSRTTQSFRDLGLLVSVWCFFSSPVRICAMSVCLVLFTVLSL